MNLDRILVLGWSGAGKTLFTSGMTGEDVLHLDDFIVTHGPKATQQRRTKEAILRQLEFRRRWIAEGMQGLRLLPEILPLVDLVIWIHGGNPGRVPGGYKWRLRLTHAARTGRAKLWEVRNGCAGRRIGNVGT